MPGTGGNAGSGGTGGATPPTELCLTWPLVLPAAGTGGGDAGGTQGTGGQPADAGSIVDAGGSQVADAAVPPCPTDPSEVVALFESLGCPHGWEPREVVSGPVATTTPNVCCYETYLRICGPGGRPYLEEDASLLADVRAPSAVAMGGGWVEGPRPDAVGLSADDRAILGAAWTQDALREHASIASFARVALGLLAVGAPADLVRATHEASLDEARHAKLCFALASTYAGHDVAPGAFPVGDRVTVASSVADLAAAAAAEGCVGETVAALLAAEQLAYAIDPAVRAALERIADDEARHAELAWRTVAWAVRADPSARDAASRAFARSFASVAADAATADGEPEPSRDVLAHGRLGSGASARLAVEIVERVIAPAARLLLDVGGAPRERSTSCVATA
jgi:hypothetical protein